MTEAQVKAKELVENYYTLLSFDLTKYQAKELATMQVDGLIKEHTWASPISWNLQRKKYWESVKEAITKL